MKIRAYSIAIVLIPLLLLASLAMAEAPMSLDEARELAAKNDPQAQYNLGLRYATGEGVDRDPQQAIEWYTRAANNGHDLAQNNLGAMYETGKGVDADQQTAVRWYRAAAEQGQKYAQNSLAIMLFKGEGVERDPVMAYVYMRLAAEQDYDVAQRNSDLIFQALSEEQKVAAQMKLAEVWEQETREYQRIMTE